MTLEQVWESREIIQREGRVLLILKSPVGHKRIDITGLDAEGIKEAVKKELDWFLKIDVPEEPVEPEEPEIEKVRKAVEKIKPTDLKVVKVL